MVVRHAVRAGFYLDSVALMRLARDIESREEVEVAALMMGSASNQVILVEAELLRAPLDEASGGDLIIAVRATSLEAAESALFAALQALDRPSAPGATQSTWRPRSLRSALEHRPDANLALISVPGDLAVHEARRALRAGLNVMIFSDNIALTDEKALKQEARSLGRLVMGPDCGTAIVGGVPLAFANVVPPGSVGIVGASGTGIQEVACLIARRGAGISHAIGVGGRDLHAEIGAISTLMAIDALDADPATEHLVVISKPPPQEVAIALLARLGRSPKPATVCFLDAEPMETPANVVQVDTLDDAAAAATGRAPHRTGTIGSPRSPSTSAAIAARSTVRGLFAGGTLCVEAQTVLLRAGVAVGSNVPVAGASRGAHGDGHLLLDLGADEFTRGRPHPMIDPVGRDAAFIAALADPQVGVILFDLVLGFGAHPDPAGHLAALLRTHHEGPQPVLLASVTGTDQDPQRRDRQVATLQAAGVEVTDSNAGAAHLAAERLQAIS